MSRWQDNEHDDYEIEIEYEVEDPRLIDGRTPRTTSYSEFSEYPGSLTGSSPLYWLSPLCPHPPQRVLTSEAGGWNIYAGAGPDCMGDVNRFDLLLNLTGSSVFRGHTVPVPELKQWASPMQVPEIVLDWPDMGIVHLSRDFWNALIDYLAQTRANMLVFCVGGHGRTGTAIASLMAACGWSSSDAIGWTRAHYCTRAIETEEQEEYVRWIAGEILNLHRSTKARRPSKRSARETAGVLQINVDGRGLPPENEHGSHRRHHRRCLQREYT